MKYYQYAGESDLGIGTVYTEVDTDNDSVTRQVQNYGEIWRFGLDNGEKLIGHITDRNASELSLKQEEEISRETFERAWKRATEFKVDAQ